VARAAPEDGTLEVEEPEPPPRYAFVGVRSCDLHAVAIQDRVFIGDRYVEPDYEARRRDAFFVAVNCGRAGGTCFCSSMDTGPRVTAGFDLALTEVLDERGHRFVVEVGSDRGTEVLDAIEHREADADERGAPDAAAERARASMGRTLDVTDIRDLLQANAEHPRWDEVADRCLSCGNCTLVCPTCFCSTVEDTTDLAGGETEHTRLWDSCFTLQHSYANGGSVRRAGRSRYRQWMTHKLSTWIDQFGSSGCVGCGRCITWCPVAIDITERRLRSAPATCGRLRMPTIEDLLQELTAFKALAPEHRAELASCARNCAFQADEWIMREGEDASAFYVIREGAVALQTAVPGRGRWSSDAPRRRAARLVMAGFRRTRPRSTPARWSPRMPSSWTEPACAASARPTRPGYDLMKLISSGLRRAPPGHAAAAARPLREGRRMTEPPAAFRVVDKQTRDGGHLDLGLAPAEPARGQDAVRPRAVRDALRVGVGEAPISVSAIGSDGAIAQTVRATGAVTTAACAAEPGDVLGLRGPFGTVWPLGDAEGRDVVVIAGGIGLAPLRPVVHELLAHRDRYGSVSLLYGGRSPENLLYVTELEAWGGRFDIDVDVIVDVATPTGAVAWGWSRA
jgi:ferredoxin